MNSFHEAFDDRFALMVMLYAQPDVRIHRIQRRAVDHFGNQIREGGERYEEHQQLLKRNREYEQQGSPNLKEHQARMDSVPCSKLTLNGETDLETNATRIVERWNGLINQEEAQCSQTEVEQ